MNRFKRPSFYKEKVIKEEIIIPCDFCQADSVGHLDKVYFCANNKCSTQLWIQELSEANQTTKKSRKDEYPAQPTTKNRGNKR